MSAVDIKRLSKALKALSNPNRLQMFLNLLEESQEAGNIEVHNCFLAKLIRNLNVGAPTVSHHVKELVNADLIHTTKDGKQLICSINPEMVAELRDLFTYDPSTATSRVAAEAAELALDAEEATATS